MPVVRFKWKSRCHIQTNGTVREDHQAYWYPRISRYGILGYATKTTYQDSGSNHADSVFITRMSALVFDGYVTEHNKKILFSDKGYKTVKVKTRSRMRGWGPGKEKVVTIMYFPIHRQRTVVRSKT
ncbi:MAG TPA: hypothetical protein VL651_13280 [Bacteroidia bacterium]|nr:hypothetical protein [Bacteroidia bacterium]